MFFAAIDHHLRVNTLDLELVEKHFFVMTRCQHNAGWHQNLTNTSLKSLQANGRQLCSIVPICSGHRKESAARSRRNCGACSFNINSFVSSRSNVHDNVLAIVYSQR